MMCEPMNPVPPATRIVIALPPPPCVPRFRGSCTIIWPFAGFHASLLPARAR